MNFIRDSAIDKHDETFFRTTRDLVTAARHWRKISNDRIRPVGQNMPRWETLYRVAYSGEELTQKELARLISVTGPTMVHMLDSLARDGLIERRHSTVDRRVTINSITDEGRRVVHDIMGVTNALRRELLDQIDPAKLAVALEVLGDIRKRLDEMQ